jgi:hypothetical protein
MVAVNVEADGNVQILQNNYAQSFYADAGLNDLADSASTVALTYSPPSGSSTAKVLVTLGAITTASLGTLTLTDGTDSYYINVASGAGSRRVEFDNIPNALLASFSVTNGLGVALASSGNSLAIIPL